MKLSKQAYFTFLVCFILFLGVILFHPEYNFAGKLLVKQTVKCTVDDPSCGGGGGGGCTSGWICLDWNTRVYVNSSCTYNINNKKLCQAYQTCDQGV